MSLNDEIEETRKTIRTDSYAMSIGELMNLFENDELNIHPDFQRFFRWSPEQKTNLIESILLGIPLPPIFVAQTEAGTWEVIDGLQRLSTIFEFAGLLKDENKEAVPPLVLQKAKYLPSLRGKYFEQFTDEIAEDDFFNQKQRIDFKRSKIGVTIIERESDDKAKYELFQRLNTGGTHLSAQEVRNCVFVMINREEYGSFRDMCLHNDYRETISLTDRALEERYDMELALRFIVFRVMGEDSLRNIGDLNQFLTDKLVEIAQDINFEWDKEIGLLRKHLAYSIRH